MTFYFCCQQLCAVDVIDDIDEWWQPDQRPPPVSLHGSDASPST